MKKRTRNNIFLIIIVFIIIFCIITIVHGIRKQEYNSSYQNEQQSDITEQNEDIERYKISTYVTDEMREKATIGGGILELRFEFTPEKLKELCTDIAIVRTISHDYIDPKAGFLEMTFGTMLINNNIYGNLNEGDVVKYIKAGGYIDMETWNNAQPEAAKESRIRTRKIMGITTPLNEEYINVLYSEDIELELGKTYLAYLAYNEKLDAYEIIGFNRGLRELDMPQESEYVSKIDIDLNNARILNNITNEYESLKEYIDNNINK